MKLSQSLPVTGYLSIALLVAMNVTACGSRKADESIYETRPVVRRDITVSVEASGVIEPSMTVELKSKASGQILDMKGETGDLVEAGTLLVQIDKRNPRNTLSQATATLEAAKARRSIAEAQARRSASLLTEKIINEVDYEQSQLELANAKAEVVRSEVAVESARIQLEDTDLRAPITGTIIEKLVETGQVISSPTMDVGGGTPLLKMADLTSVEVRTLVSETDIGKIRPGQAAVVTVTALPNQPFQGEVQKIEPQATADQTVTTFAVRIVLQNESGLLRPGMNADVEIMVSEARKVLAIPTAALRTNRDITTAAGLVGLDEATVRAQLEAAGAAAGPRGREAAPSGPVGRYWVFVQRNGAPVAVPVTTGITDLSYSELLEGIEQDELVYLLPSSGLVESQQRLQQQMRQFSGMPGGGGGGGGGGRGGR